MKRMMILGLIFLASCTYIAPGPPSEADQSAFNERIESVKPGMPETDFLAMFKPVPEKTSKQIGIVDTERYTEEGYDSRTYWLGYRYMDSDVLMTQHLVSVKCANGFVESLYWPGNTGN